jgi:predicted site-specific integrase-resolvase
VTPRSDDLADPAAVAAYLQVSVATLKDWRYRGVGPAFTRAGRLVRYDWADVRRYLQEHRQAGAVAG